MDNDTATPTIERVRAACDVLDWLGKRAAALPEDQTRAVAMGFQLAIARSYLNNFAKRLSEGLEPYDALLTAADGGDREFMERQKNLAQALVWLLEVVVRKPGSEPDGA